LCSSDEIANFVGTARYPRGFFIDPNHLRRVPDGVASRIPNQNYAGAAYEEINRFGLLFARTQFRKVPWPNEANGLPVLLYGDLFHPMCKFFYCAEKFYGSTGFRGTALIQVSLHNVAGERMTFYRIGAPFFDEAFPNDFQCIAEVIASKRLVNIDQIAAQKLSLLQDILGELAWSFWQSLGGFPRNRLNNYAAETLGGMGLR
jgi:hypothetical protein